MPYDPIRERADLLFQQFQWRVRPYVHVVPAAQLHLAQLGMIERIPVDESFALEYFIVPFEQFKIILDRMLTKPVDELVLFDARLLLRAPEFHGPGEDAHVIIGPRVEAAGDDLLWMIFEIVKDRNVWIP